MVRLSLVDDLIMLLSIDNLLSRFHFISGKHGIIVHRGCERLVIYDAAYIFHRDDCCIELTHDCYVEIYIGNKLVDTELWDHEDWIDYDPFAFDDWIELF